MMKVTAIPRDKVFQPVDVTFTLETQKELDALGTLFNTTSIVRILNTMCIGDRSSWGNVHPVFESLGADIHQVSRFTR